MNRSLRNDRMHEGNILKGIKNSAMPQLKEGGNVDMWMQDVHPKKGALHKELGIPEDRKIPTKTLEKDAHSSNPLLEKRANLALRYRGRAMGGPAPAEREAFHKKFTEMKQSRASKPVSSEVPQAQKKGGRTHHFAGGTPAIGPASASPMQKRPLMGANPATWSPQRTQPLIQPGVMKKGGDVKKKSAIRERNK